jgi:hypothetical protein
VMVGITKALQELELVLFDLVFGEGRFHGLFLNAELTAH